jgi:MoaA/NifB/PqqE/SkfB family radical SAM enzyme
MSFKFYAAPPTADKSTRDCLDPWFMIYISADRTVKPCCPHGPVGVLSDDTTLTDILNGPEMRELRRSLLEGDLDGECASCPTRPLTDPESLRRKLRVQLARAAHEPVKP